MTAFTFDDPDMLVTTAHQLDGFRVVEQKGVVIADVTPGRHLGKDFFAGLRNLFGGRSRSWEHTLRDNQQQALQELVDEAKQRGANAVIAVDLEDEALGQGGMMNMKVSGTAVVVEREGA